MSFWSFPPEEFTEICLVLFRELEKIFDVIDARRKNSMTGEAAGMTNVTLPDQAEIIR